MERSILSYSLSGVLLIGVCTAPTFGSDDEVTYHERLEFDPDTLAWVEKAPPIPGTEGGDLAVARSQLARGDYDDARDGFEAWFENYPDSQLWGEALFYAAETEIVAVDLKPKDGDLIRAYEWLEELLEGWPSTDLSDRALRKEMIIAEMILFKGRKQKIWGGVFWFDATEEALEMLNRIIDMWAPQTPIAEQALRLKADYHFHNGEFEEAETAYSRLMRDFPRGRYHKIAMLRSGQSALARFPGINFDEADLLEAEFYFRDFARVYALEAGSHNVPQTLSRITESLAHKEYSIAQYYERTDEINAAVYYYRWVLKRYPATTWSALAENRLLALGAKDDETYEREYDEVIQPIEPEDNTTLVYPIED